MRRDPTNRLRAKLALRRARDGGRQDGIGDGYVRETFTLPRDAARERARAFLNAYPKAAYMSAVEDWSELPDGRIAFTMRRLPSAD
jgi:hypothetical protein